MRHRVCWDCSKAYKTNMKYSKYCKDCRTLRSGRWKNYDDTREGGYRKRLDLKELKGGN